MTQEAATRSQAREIPERVRQMRRTDNPVIDYLQQQVANSMVLFMNYKQYHWQVAGPLSSNLQALFDEFAREMLSLLDGFCERLCVLGSAPVLELEGVRRTATVECGGIQGDFRGTIEEAYRNSRRQVVELKQAVAAAVNEGDPGTAELFSMATRTQEKHEWNFRRMLRTAADVLEMPATQ